MRTYDVDVFRLGSLTLRRSFQIKVPASGPSRRALRGDSMISPLLTSGLLFFPYLDGIASGIAGVWDIRSGAWLHNLRLTTAGCVPPQVSLAAVAADGDELVCAYTEGRAPPFRTIAVWPAV